MDRYRKRNPYFHAYAAEAFIDIGDYDEAQYLIQNAIRLKRDEPDFYETSARIYLAQGMKLVTADSCNWLRSTGNKLRAGRKIRVMESRLIVRSHITPQHIRD